MLRSAKVALALTALLAPTWAVAAAGKPVPYLVADINPDDDHFEEMGWNGVFGFDPGPVRVEDSYPMGLSSDGSRVYFYAHDGVHGREPWVSDGTAEGTRLLIDLVPGSVGSVLRIPFSVPLPIGPVVVLGPWATDGTRAGTRQIHWRSPEGVFGPLGGRYFFLDNSRNLWSTDGYFARIDIRCGLFWWQCPIPSPGPDAAGTEGFYYLSDNRTELRWIDAATGRSHRLFVNPKGWLTSFSPLAGGAVVSVKGSPSELWFVRHPGAAVRLDGHLERSFEPPTMAGVVDDVLMIVRNGRLLRTDGTLEGTRDLGPFGLRNDVELLPGLWVHLGRTDDCDRSLVTYRPSTDRLVRECLFPSIPYPARFQAFSAGHFLLFQISDSTRAVQHEYWAWDGTSGGLRKLGVLDGTGIYRSGDVRDGRYFVWAVHEGTTDPSSESYETELWSTDGTPQGTGRVLGPWRADWSLTSPDMPGSMESTLAGYAFTDDRLFLSARFDERGFELWAVDLADLAEPDLRLHGGRYEVRVRWRNQHGGLEEGEALARPESGESGFFWFFRRENLELVAKVLDGSAVNGHDWVFWGGITDLEYWLEVTDVETGATRTYHHPPGDLCGGSDTAAFAHAPGPDASKPGLAGGPVAASGVSFSALAEPAASARANAASPYGPCPTGALCLGDDARFAARVRFANQYAGGVEGTGRPVPVTDRSGYFWFFRPDNLEVMVKVLDGTPVNGHHWVLTGGLTTVEHWLDVTDRSTGAVRTYHHSAGSSCGRADTAAF